MKRSSFFLCVLVSLCYYVININIPFIDPTEVSMEFHEYQIRSRQTAQYPPIGHAVIYPTLGLVNEAGEVAGKIKKVFRDKDGLISEETCQALKAELGDVLWYLAQVTTELGLDLEEVAEDNLAKLRDRQKRGRIGGEGDTR